MKKMVCEICSSTDFTKVGDQFECGGCGCRYSLETARGLLQEVVEETPSVTPEVVATPLEEEEPAQDEMIEADVEEDDEEEQEQGLSGEVLAAQFGAELYGAQSPNRIRLEVIDIGHWVMTGYNQFGAPMQSFVVGPSPQGYLGCRMLLAVTAGKAVRSATIYVTPYNAKGRIVKCNATGESTRPICANGPVYQGQSMVVAFSNAWLNPVVQEVVVEQAVVEYLDGTRELYLREDYHFEKGILKAALKAKKHTLMLTRKSQFSFMNVDMIATIDGQSQTIDNGKTVEFLLAGGDYELTVSFGDQRTAMTVELDETTKLGFSINPRGELDVEAIPV